MKQERVLHPHGRQVARERRVNELGRAMVM